MTYVVRLEAFEGPLDLLLYLIQREEMDIYDIPIARITEQYLQHLQGMERLDLQPAGEFLVMAATLMRIKARMLLPVQRPGEPPEEDPRQELVQRLLEYKKFKEAARKLEEHEAERLRTFVRPLDESLRDLIETCEDEVTFEVNVGQILKALEGVLGRLNEVVTHDVDLEPVSLEDRVGLLRHELQEHGRIAWSDLFRDVHTRLEVIVTFMALLELMKAGEVRVHQADSRSELWIFRREPAEAGAAATAAAPDRTPSTPARSHEEA